MSEENAIAKKIETARKANAPIPRLQDVLAILTKRIEKTARTYLGVVVEAMIMDIETKVFSDVLDAMSMPAMIGILEIDRVDRAAIINLDLDLVHHAVDLRLGGSPSESPDFSARRPTSIDSSMCLPLVDLVMNALSEGFLDTFGPEVMMFSRCTGFEHLPMLANIASERADVLCIQVSLDIGEAARSGDFEIVFPYSTLDRIAARIRATARPTPSAGEDAWADHMMNVVLETGLDLLPVLQSARYSVAELSRLEIGTVIPLEPGVQNNIDLWLRMPERALQVARAKLGAFKGSKALKLTEDPDESFLAPLRELAPLEAVVA